MNAWKQERSLLTFSHNVNQKGFFILKINTITQIWPKIFLFSSVCLPIIMHKIHPGLGSLTGIQPLLSFPSPLLGTIAEIQIFHSYCIFVWNKTSRGGTGAFSYLPVISVACRFITINSTSTKVNYVIEEYLEKTRKVQIIK